ncbi:MAG TPA: hypothetical protein VGI46_06820 [Candidatus Acidoferrum sp.]|jgi:hypothetical protein
MTEETILLVDKICEGKLPQNEDGFVAALSSLIVPADGSPDLNGCDRNAIKNCFEASVREAIATMRASEAALRDDTVN